MLNRYKIKSQAYILYVYQDEDTEPVGTFYGEEKVLLQEMASLMAEGKECHIAEYTSRDRTEWTLRLMGVIMLLAMSCVLYYTNQALQTAYADCEWVTGDSK